MAVTPINITRVSNNLRSQSLLESLRQNTLRLFLEQNRLATGNKLNSPSEDPAAAMQALNLTEAMERQDQILANIRHADSFLSATDTAIGGISDLLIQARSIASEMVNSTTDQSQRDSSAELVKGIINELVRKGNTQFGDVYIFGGQQTTTAPFTQESGGVEYQGDTRSLLSHVDFQQDAQINMHGAELFGALSTQVAGYVDLNPAVTTDARLADLSGAAGLGVGRGQIRITLDNPATTFLVDLTQADDIGDVIDAINTAAANAGLTVGAGNDFYASRNPTLDGLQIGVAAGTVSVTEAGSGSTARELGILAGGVGTIVGGDVGTKLTPMTLVGSLFGEAGAALGSIEITNGTLSATIDLSGAATVQDILNQINTAGVEVVAKINEAGTGIDVLSRMSGGQMRIGEAGTGTAELLGIRSSHGTTALSELNQGRGVTNVEGKADFRIIARDGSTVDVDIDGAQTIQDVLDAINTSAATAGVAIAAGLAVSGNGIRIVDSTGGAGVLSVQRLNLSAAIDDLGLNKSAAAGANELISDDTNGIRTNSVFSALIDLYQSLKSGSTAGITDAGDRIGGFITVTNRLHGIVGARSQAMTNRLNLTEDAVVATQKLLSEVKDVDYAEAVTRFQQAQTTLQANLMTGSRMLQLSLLDFIQ